MDRIQTNRFKRIENFFNLIKNENEHRRLARTRIFHQTIYYGSLLFFLANFFLGHQQLQVFILFNQTTIKKMSLGQHPRLSTLCYILGLISSIVTTHLLFRPIEKPIFMILYEILVLHQNNLSSQILVTKLTDPSTPIRMQRSIRFAEWLLERSINFQCKFNPKKKFDERLNSQFFLLPFFFPISFHLFRILCKFFAVQVGPSISSY